MLRASATVFRRVESASNPNNTQTVDHHHAAKPHSDIELSILSAEQAGSIRVALLRCLSADKDTSLAARQQLLSVEPSKEFDQFRNDTRPPGLMAGSQAGAIVAVEIFVEQQVVFPEWIRLEFLRSPVNRPPA